MKKLCVIIPSDALLFKGFKEAVELGWKHSVEAAIAMSGFTVDTPAAASAVLAKREELKVGLTVPKNILRKSYAALEDFDFSDEECIKIADGIGSTLYLEEYTKASQTNLTLTQTGLALLKVLKAKVADGYEVDLVRSEEKRERFIGSNGESVSLMEAESQIIKNLFPTIPITHCGMMPDGGSYIAPLALAGANEGMNIVVLPFDAIAPRIVDETHRKITGPLTEAANNNTLRVIAIDNDHSPTQATYFSRLINGSNVEVNGAIVHPAGLRSVINQTIALINEDGHDADPGSDAPSAPPSPAP